MTAQSRRWKTVLRPALLIVSVVLLNLLVGVYRWAPDPGLLTLFAPTLETAVVLMILVGTTMMNSRRARWIHWPLAIVLMALVLFGIGEGFYQTIFRKGFVPWTDLSFLPALLNMVLHTSAFNQPLLVALPVAGLAAVATTALYGLIRWIDSTVRSVSWPTSSVIASVFLGLAIPALLLGLRTPLLLRAARQIKPPADELAITATTGAAGQSVPSQPDEEYYFARLRDRDIHLFIVESYGHTLLTNDSHRPLIQPVYEELQATLREAGYWVYSGFLTSPAFGGRSWLADSTILTGIFIDSQHKYDEIVESKSRNLTHILGDAGYHRVLAAPGTYEADATWRAFYEFDEYLFRYDFGYAGPFISFGAMPDQYLIYRTHKLIADSERPLFANYVLVSSHVPFDQLPQYVDDWDALEDGSIFNELELRKFDNNWLSGGEYPEGYVASIGYTLTAITKFVTEVVADGSLFIIIGDHQPRIPISEADSTFSVPIHVIARDQALVADFSHFGLTPGFRPAQEPPHAGMDSFLGMLLEVAHGRAASYDQLAQ